MKTPNFKTQGQGELNPIGQTIFSDREKITQRNQKRQTAKLYLMLLDLLSLVKKHPKMSDEELAAAMGSLMFDVDEFMLTAMGVEPGAPIEIKRLKILEKVQSLLTGAE